MSFGNEIKGFVAGFKSGQEIRRNWQDEADKQLDMNKKKPATDANLATQPDQTGGAKVTTATPQVDSGTTSSTGAKLANRGGGPFVQQAYDYYRSRGLGHAAAAGIAGNLMQESGGAADVLGGHRRGDNGKSAFAAQWQGQRLNNLYKFAGSQQPTLQQQLDFVLEEMNPNSPYVDGQAAKAFPAMQAAQSVQDATALFRANFERPSADDLGSRTQHAMTAKDLGNYPQTTFSFGGTGTMPSTESGVLPEEGAAPAAKPKPKAEPLAAGEKPEKPARLSPAAGADTATGAAKTQIVAPQVTGFAGEGLLPPGEEETLFAGSGGVIPEPHFASGGFADDGLGGFGTDSQPKAADQSSGFTNTAAGTGGFSGGGFGENQDLDVQGGGFGTIKAPTWNSALTATPLASPQTTPAAAPTVATPTVEPQATPATTGAIPDDPNAALNNMAGRDFTQAETTAMTDQPAATTPDPTTPTPPAATTPAATTPAAVTPAVAAKPLTPAQKAAADKAAADKKNLDYVTQLSKAYPVRGMTPQQLAAIPNDQLAQYARAYQGEPGGAYRVVNGEIQKIGHGVHVPKGQGEAMYQYAMQKIGRAGQQANNKFSQAMTNRRGVRDSSRYAGWSDHSNAGGRKAERVGYRMADERANKATRGLHFAEGGVIPEEGDRNATFERYLREEKGDRDRAAKRMSALEGKATSSAYDPDGYFKPKVAPKTKPAAGGSPSLPSSAPTPTARPSTNIPAAGTPTAGYEPKKPIYEPGGGEMPQEQSPSNTPNSLWRPDMMTGPEGVPPDLVAKPKIPAAGTPFPTDKPAIPEPDIAEDRATRYKSTLGDRARGRVGAANTAIADAVTPDVPVTPPAPDQLQVNPMQMVVDQSPAPTPADQQPPEVPVIPEPEAEPVVRPDDTLAAISRAPQTRLPPVPDPPVAASKPVAPGATAPVVAPAEDPLASISRGPRESLPAPKLVTTGSGASSEIIQRFQQMMAEAPTEEEQRQIAREAVRHGLRYIFDDWGDKNVLGYAEGGIIPEEEEDPLQSQHEPNYMETAGQAPANSQAQYDQVSATPKLKEDVSQSTRGGLDFLKRIFGLGGRGDGAIPTPESQQQGSNGSMRMAKGEGAATQEEVDEIDNTIDPERRLSEADRHQTRLAKTMTFYLEQGRKEDAESVAGSLLLYGAQRSSQLGSMAGAAYAQYQQTQNPEDLQNAVKYIEKAYEMVPDASGLDIQIAPDGSGLVMNKVDSEGEVEQIPIDPAALPQILRGIQDKSLYWREVTRVADQGGLHQKEGFEHDDRTAAQSRKEKITDDYTKREQDEADHARDRGETLTDADTARKQVLEDAGRTRKESVADKELEQQRKIGDELRANKQALKLAQVRADNVIEAREAAKGVVDDEGLKKWEAELGALGDPPKKADDPEGYAQYMQDRNAALSRMVDAFEKPQAGLDYLKKLGVDLEDYDYIAQDGETSDAGGDGDDTDDEGGLPDDLAAEYPDAYQNSAGVWLYKTPNGKAARVPGAP